MMVVVVEVAGGDDDDRRNQKHKGQHQIKYLSVLAKILLCNENGNITTRISSPFFGI